MELSLVPALFNFAHFRKVNVLGRDQNGANFVKRSRVAKAATALAFFVSFPSELDPVRSRPFTLPIPEGDRSGYFDLKAWTGLRSGLELNEPSTSTSSANGFHLRVYF